MGRLIDRHMIRLEQVLKPRWLGNILLQPPTDSSERLRHPADTCPSIVHGLRRRSRSSTRRPEGECPCSLGEKDNQHGSRNQTIRVPKKVNGSNHKLPDTEWYQPYHSALPVRASPRDRSSKTTILKPGHPLTILWSKTDPVPGQLPA